MDYGFLAGDRDPPRPADASWESAWRLIWTDRERQGTYRRGKLTDDQLETHLATLDTDGASRTPSTIALTEGGSPLN